MRFPTVVITRYPNVFTPMATQQPATNSAHSGVSGDLQLWIPSLTVLNTAEKGAVAFPVSLEPCANDSSAALNTIRYLNTVIASFFSGSCISFISCSPSTVLSKAPSRLLLSFASSVVLPPLLIPCPPPANSTVELGSCSSSLPCPPSCLPEPPISAKSSDSANVVPPSSTSLNPRFIAGLPPFREGEGFFLPPALFILLLVAFTCRRGTSSSS
mmetsp:Transcript_45635/g.73372  ORF Transcript_45635/g.73372 Transcript_45635/m.73372 type:complete len:214 (+) Transcript_45635:633-1274(+)